MKRIIVALLFIVVASAAAAQTQFVRYTPSKVRTLAREQNKLIFMDVYATWCGPCHTMSREVFPDKQVGSFMDSLFVSVKVDIESYDGKDIAAQYKISSIPAFLVFTPDMELVGHTSGARSKQAFMRDMTTIVDRYRKRQSCNE